MQANNYIIIIGHISFHWQLTMNKNIDIDGDQSSVKNKWSHRKNNNCEFCLFSAKSKCHKFKIDINRYKIINIAMGKYSKKKKKYVRSLFHADNSLRRDGCACVRAFTVWGGREDCKGVLYSIFSYSHSNMHYTRK